MVSFVMHITPQFKSKSKRKFIERINEVRNTEYYFHHSLNIISHTCRLFREFLPPHFIAEEIETERLSDLPLSYSIYYIVLLCINGVFYLTSCKLHEDKGYTLGFLSMPST